ncbi:MAG: hypothetical protein U5R31_16705 [Acidimicrobiia bacterium]|nr:hypothetical protein [Acidimicrobiia bacterium]
MPTAGEGVAASDAFGNAILTSVTRPYYAGEAPNGVEVYLPHFESASEETIGKISAIYRTDVSSAWDILDDNNTTTVSSDTASPPYARTMLRIGGYDTTGALADGYDAAGRVLRQYTAEGDEIDFDYGSTPWTAPRRNPPTSPSTAPAAVDRRSSAGVQRGGPRDRGGHAAGDLK